MKGIYTEQVNNMQSTTTTMNFNLSNGLHGVRFDKYELYRGDLEDLICLAKNDPSRLLATLDNLVVRLPLPKRLNNNDS